MSQMVHSDHCIGCSACVNTCPTGAIRMEMDPEGFYAIGVDGEKCISCGLCEKVCPVLCGPSSSAPYRAAYAVWAAEERMRQSSSSGGVFPCVARRFLEKTGGTVYGVCMDAAHRAVHTGVTSAEQLDKLRGSKYVQSDMGTCFPEIREKLERGESVLFSGTGCQVSGLRRFLRREYASLFTVDLVCHGVPSPGLFRDYIRFLEKKHRAEVDSYLFRQKNEDFTQQSYDTKIVFRQGGRSKTKRISGDDDFYTIRFLSNQLQNQNCFRCRFTSLNRDADLTLGDYWGIQEVHPEIGPVNGVSLVLVSSEKGERLLSAAAGDLHMVETSKEKILLRNHHLKEPSPKNPYRDTLYAAYRKRGFDSDFYYRTFVGKDLGVYRMKRMAHALLNKEKT